MKSPRRVLGLYHGASPIVLAVVLCACPSVFYKFETRNALMASDAQLVREFTAESTGIELPERPRPMSKEEVRFLAQMLIDELYEFVGTYERSPKVLLHELVDKGEREFEPIEGVELIAAQADALVDSYYYSLNAAAKAGCNLSKLFHVVHQANMNKRFPDGTFHRRPDGKVEKPPDWSPPGVTAEIESQIKNGAWA